MRHTDFRSIGNITGLMVNNLVARTRNGTDYEVKRLTDSNRHNALMNRIIIQIIVAGHIVADRLAQRKQSEV